MPCWRARAAELGSLVNRVSFAARPVAGNSHSQAANGSISTLSHSTEIGPANGRSDNAACFQIDYIPFASLLAKYAGRVLDVGGGIGVARHFLPAGADYIVVDPSLTWLSLDWTAPSVEFPCLASPPCFVRGVGEQLPFRDGTFDSALAFWSLNHSRDPATVFCEVHRILARKGRFLAVLEDMIPRWRDVLLPAHQACGSFRWPQIIARKARSVLSGRGWPLQSDHFHILEEEMATWVAGRFRVAQRGWIAQYLTFEFARV
jgi:SAM-dependent methyltransferase